MILFYGDIDPNSYTNLLISISLGIGAIIVGNGEDIVFLCLPISESPPIGQGKPPVNHLMLPTNENPKVFILPEGIA